MILIHTFSNLFMLVVILFVQRVHYPSFLFVDPQKWIPFHAFHSRRIGQIVILPMAAQIVSLFLIDPFSWSLCFFNLLSIGTTAAVSMNIHRKLSKEFSVVLIKKLIDSNWLRVIGWLGASIQSLYMTQ